MQVDAELYGLNEAEVAMSLYSVQITEALHRCLVEDVPPYF